MLEPRLCCAALAVATLAAAAGVMPLPDRPLAAQERPVIRVEYRDLNLARREGVKSLDDRVRRAARRLCTAELRMAIPPERRACVKSAIRDSRKQVGTAVSAFGATRLAGAGTVDDAVRTE